MIYRLTRNENEWHNKWQLVKVKQKVTTNCNKLKRVTVNDNDWSFRLNFFFFASNTVLLFILFYFHL